MVQQNLMCPICIGDKSFEVSGVSWKDLKGLSWLFCEDCIHEDLRSSFLKRIIFHHKCDLEHAEHIFDRMLSMGLDLKLITKKENYEKFYVLNEFAIMREYISTEENEKLLKEKNIKIIVKNLEKKYLKKYGPDKMKWPRIQVK